MSQPASAAAPRAAGRTATPGRCARPPAGQVRGDLALGGPLGSGPDVDQQRSPVQHLLEGRADADAPQPAAGVSELVVDPVIGRGLPAAPRGAGAAAEQPGLPVRCRGAAGASGECGHGRGRHHCSPAFSTPVACRRPVEQGVAGHAAQRGGVDVHRQGGRVAEVGDVVDVVAAERTALALPEAAVRGRCPRPGVLGERRPDGEERALGLEVVVPAGGRPDRPADQPDLEVGGGVEAVPGALGGAEVDAAARGRGRWRTAGRCAAAGYG